jgi:hypothetical protein
MPKPSFTFFTCLWPWWVIADIEARKARAFVGNPFIYFKITFWVMRLLLLSKGDRLLATLVSILVVRIEKLVPRIEHWLLVWLDLCLYLLYVVFKTDIVDRAGRSTAPLEWIIVSTLICQMHHWDTGAGLQSPVSRQRETNEFRMELGMTRPGCR